MFIGRQEVSLIVALSTRRKGMPMFFLCILPTNSKRHKAYVTKPPYKQQMSQMKT